MVGSWHLVVNEPHWSASDMLILSCLPRCLLVRLIMFDSPQSTHTRILEIEMNGVKIGSGIVKDSDRQAT
jgi:hypothetical protein